MADERFEGEESFAELFEESLRQKPHTVEPGTKVTGTVVQVGATRAFLDLGGGLDGMIELGELAERGETAVVKVGDRIEAYVVRVQDRIAELAVSMGKGPAAKQALEDAAHGRIPVEGTITAINKGGYVVEVAGVRCFCPMGQMDVRRIDDPATMLGQKHLFLITEWRGGRDLVLSRRELIEEQQAAKAIETRERLEVGATFSGVISSVRDFGAFVDIGGIDGLVHASELGYGRQRPQDLVHAGQTVEVEVLRIEAGKDGKGERISLSMRSLSEDPFDATIDELPEGTIVEGKVMRLQPFGAFVEIVPGVEGLLHVSAFGRRIGHPSELVSEGQDIAVRIDAVDRAARRISLSFVDPSELEEGGEAVVEEVAAVPAQAPVAAQPRPAAGVEVRRQKAHPAAPAAAVAAAPAVAAPAAGPAGAGVTAHGARVLGHSAPKAVSREAAEAPIPDAAPAAIPAVGAILDVTVDRVETFGVFVSWGTGRGLVPSVELGVPRGTDLRRAQPEGSTFRAVVLEVRPDGKVRLSKRGAEIAEERADAQAWMQTQGRPEGKGFGTFADLLRKKSDQ